MAGRSGSVVGSLSKVIFALVGTGNVNVVALWRLARSVCFSCDKMFRGVGIVCCIERYLR